MTQYKNKTQKALKKLAEFRDIDIDHKWQANLKRNIGQELGIKSQNLFATWILRDSIPQTSIDKIVELDIPDCLKKLFQDCKKEKIKKVTSERNPTYPLVGEQKDPLDQCFEMLRQIQAFDRKVFFTIKASLEGVLRAWKLKEEKDVMVPVERRYGERRKITQSVELDHRCADRRRPKEELGEVSI